jgi:YVTN family beta-propeller protein
MYVVNQGNSTVSVIDTSSTPPVAVGKPIKVGVIPLGIAYNPYNDNMYVTNNFVESEVGFVDEQIENTKNWAFHEGRRVRFEIPRHRSKFEQAALRCSDNDCRASRLYNSHVTCTVCPAS